MDGIKVWWKSKSMILNMVGGVASSLSIAIPYLANVQPFISKEAATIGLVWSVLGLIFRAVSKDKIVLTE